MPQREYKRAICKNHKKQRLGPEEIKAIAKTVQSLKESHGFVAARTAIDINFAVEMRDNKIWLVARCKEVDLQKVISSALTNLTIIDYIKDVAEQMNIIQKVCSIDFFIENHQDTKYYHGKVLKEKDINHRHLM